MIVDAHCHIMPPEFRSRYGELVRRDRTFAALFPRPNPRLATAEELIEDMDREGVDVAVLEVGMGGRFDATNVCQPCGVLVTNVSFDHEAYLGHTLEAIAYEKAGIIKTGVPLVIGPMAEEAHAVLRRRANELGAPLSQYGSDFTIEAQEAGDRFTYRSSTRTYSSLPCALNGAHQLVNAGCAVALLEQSVMPSRVISEESIVQGLSSVSWEGRLETIRTHPLVVCDGAHNPAAAAGLACYLHSMIDGVPERKLILLIAMMRDKNITAFLAELLPLADVLICTQIEHSRSATVHELHNELPTPAPPVYGVPTPSDALALANQLADSRDIICVTGSLFLVGAVKSMLAGSTYAPIVG